MTEDVKCPKCGSKTIIRTVVKGPDTGLKFRVCARFPKCKGRIPVEEDSELSDLFDSKETKEKKVAMVSERNIPLYIILTFITCGLFSIYWFISLAGDIAKLRQKADPNGLSDYIFGILTCGIWTLVCYYRYSKYIVEIQETRGAKVSDISTVVLILGIFGMGIVSMALMQNELNKLVEAR